MGLAAEPTGGAPDSREYAAAYSFVRFMFLASISLSVGGCAVL